MEHILETERETLKLRLLAVAAALAGLQLRQKEIELGPALALTLGYLAYSLLLRSFIIPRLAAPLLVYAMILVDTAVLLVALNLAGGIESSLFILFPLLVIYYAIHLGYKSSFFAATTVSLGLLGYATLSGQRIFSATGTNVVLQVPFFYLLAAFSGYLEGKRLQEQQEKTAKAQLYEQERERSEELKRLEEMKSDFMRAVSHELRTPLTSVRASLELLLEESQRTGDMERGRLLQNMAEGVDRLEALMTDLLEVARAQSATLVLQQDTTDLRLSVGNAVALVKPLALAREQTLEQRLPDGALLATIDGRRIEQVLLNLLSNASKFTPEGRRITISLEEGEKDAVISVSDEGPGIPEAERALVFEPFYRGRSADRAQGSGLGLTIAKALVERHAGRIWLESKLGEGSTFFVSLPKEPMEAKG